MNIDKPLDELIKTDPSGNKRRSRGGGRKRSSASKVTTAGTTKASGSAAQTQRNRQASAANAAKPPVQIPGRGVQGALGSKIILSNLPTDVTEGQVKELFTSSLGPVKKVAMNYRQNGVSTGTCTVIFQRPEDGQKAYQQYNNRLIDGKRPLRVEVVVDLAKIPVNQPEAKRAPAKAAAGAAGASRGGRRGGRSGGRAARPKKTVEDLDAEMEDYTKVGADSAPAA